MTPHSPSDIKHFALYAGADVGQAAANATKRTTRLLAELILAAGLASMITLLFWPF